MTPNAILLRIINRNGASIRSIKQAQTARMLKCSTAINCCRRNFTGIGAHRDFLILLSPKQISVIHVTCLTSEWQLLESGYASGATSSVLQCVHVLEHSFAQRQLLSWHHVFHSPEGMRHRRVPLLSRSAKWHADPSLLYSIKYSLINIVTPM